MRRAKPLALVLAGALLFTACASDEDSSSDTTAPVNSTKPTAASTTSTTLGELKDLGNGVTKDSIKIGIVYIDFAAIADFVDFQRGDQEKIAQAFVDDINESGGVNGRKLVPVYKKYIPIPGSNVFSTTTCTELTQDEDVFAVVGIVIDNTGQSQLCLAKDGETVLISHEMREEWLNQAGGLMLTADISLERRIRVLFELLAQEKTLADANKIVTLTDQNSASLVENVVTPAVETLGIDEGTAGVLTISDADTTEAQSQMDTLLATWKDEGVDVVVLTSENVNAVQFVQKIKKELPDAQLIAAVNTGIEPAAKDAITRKLDPNPYEGIITADGADAVERWNTDKLQACNAVVEERLGIKVAGPDSAKVDKNGDRDETYAAVTDFCSELSLFKTIATAAGADLTNENWKTVVDGFGPIEVVPSEFASLGANKYAADDAQALVAWDSSLNKGLGAWTYLTEVADITGLG